MVFAISAPALALIEDRYPPEWGDGVEYPIATAVWQLDEDVDYSWPDGGPYPNPPDGVTPSCIQGTQYGSNFGTFAGWYSWANGILTINSDGVSVVVGVPPEPDDGGNTITCQVTIACSSAFIAEESPGIQIWRCIRDIDPPYGCAPTESYIAEYIFGNGEGVVDRGDGYYTFTADFTYTEDVKYIGAVIFGAEFTMQGIIVDAVIHYSDDGVPEGEARSSCVADLSPISIDPNVMTVYETDETQGDFGVSLLNEPPAGATITVTVDPNGNGDSWNEDIRLLGVTNPLDPNNTVTLTFTDTTGGDPCDPYSWTPGNCTDWDPATRTSCWNVPQTIVFKAIDDDIAEPPKQVESQYILVTSSWPGHESDANYVGEKFVTVKVDDNDQPNIIFALAGGPLRDRAVKLLEYRRCTFWSSGTCLGQWITYPQTVSVTMQVEPRNDSDPCEPGYVRVIVTEEGGAGNPPSMTPPLLPQSPVEPNAIVFTSDGNPPPTGVIGAVTKWDVPYDIVLLGVDDDELQAEGAEGGYPSVDGDQYYQASLVFSVDDTTDARYTPETEPEGLVRTVDIDIEDNECGALGILTVDISNPYYLMTEAELEALLGPDHRDPNDWIDDDGSPMPDCRADIYDILEFAKKWLNCSDPQGSDCTRYDDL